MSLAWTASIPSPSFREIGFGGFDVRIYALTLLTGVAVAAWLTMRRWKAQGGDPDLVLEVTLWSVAFGLIGGRIYHVITSYDQLGDEWWAPFAIWEGGLGIWGGIALGVAAGAVVVKRRGASVARFADAAAPGVLIAQGIGRLGNYFNQELFGEPTTLPWALEIDLGFRPVGFETVATYHPVFLYEMLWNFGGAAALILIGRRWTIRPPGIFALYVAIYSGGRLIWEQLRIDPSQTFAGQRLNFYVALVLFLGGLIAFWWIQFRPGRPQPEAETASGLAASGGSGGAAVASGGGAAKAPRSQAQKGGTAPRRSTKRKRHRV